MIATGHQPVFMPWLGLIHKIASADLFISWDDVPMESSGFENRNRIPGPDGGQSQWLTVPVLRSRDAKIKDVEIAKEHDWQRKQLRTIVLTYAKAPYWAKYEPTFTYLYEQQTWTSLAALNDQILTFLLHEFDVHTKRITLSSLGLTTSKEQLVLDACKKVGAWKYIFGTRGPDYASAQPFRDAGVEPFVQEYSPRVYDQIRHQVFVPNLWAFDLLLNKGPDEGREIMLAGGSLKRME